MTILLMKQKDALNSRCSFCPRSNATGEQQYNDNDQENAADADPGVTKTVTIPAKPTTEAAKQVNDENDD
jgi:hypothetical protein